MAARTAKALPQVESTILVEHTDAKLIRCTARKAFTLGNASVKEGEIFFLVRSERRVNRYYVVHFNELRGAYQCSCGCNMCEHEHLKTVREFVMNKVVIPANKASNVPSMTIPATVAEVRKVRKARKAAKVEHEPVDGSKIDWDVVMRADRARQKAWADEYRNQAEELREAALASN
jgi:hypothetical protein